MNSSQSITKLAEAMAAAQAELGNVAKGGRNDYDKYRYATLENYVQAVHRVIGAHGLSFVSSVEEVVALEDRTTQKGGKEHAVRVKVVGRIIHASGEWQEASAWGEGQDRADKAVYKAITGARKYLLAAAFDLATTDDPEQDETVGRSGPPAQRDGQPPERETSDTRRHRDAQAPQNVQRLEDGTVVDRDTGEAIDAPRATAQQVRALRDLLEEGKRRGVASGETASKWYAKYRVKALEELSSTDCMKLTQAMRAKIDAAPATASGKSLGGVPNAATSAA